ncbi:MAG: FIST N-terminal domain-containing protein [Candidatus Methylacidiphilales bacterium]|nr:FIST N-terminal domain-containing protein [Candidatus Methylacidiphilales bacterium]
MGAPNKLAAVSKYVAGNYSEAAVKEAARTALADLGVNPTLGLVFVSSDYIPHLTDFLELIRLHAHVPLLVGSSAYGLVGDALETEEESGFTMLLLSLPDCQAVPFTFNERTVEDANGPGYWHHETGVMPEAVKAWLVLSNPFQLNIDPWLRRWNEAYPRVPTFGGLASSTTGDPEAWIFMDDRIVEGAVAVALCGNLEVRCVVSQGCRPIGEPLTVTHTEKNVLLSLGGKPAYEVLNDVFRRLSNSEKERAKGHLFAGLAMNEYVEDFKRGDFLVRNIIAADPHTGAVAISGKPRVGQTMQYHLRDAESASEDLHKMLSREAKDMAPFKPVAGFLCTCNGRGVGLFGVPSHDAKAVVRHFPGVPLAGFFANGEIGPVGDRSFIHSYTASLALIGSLEL